MKREFSAGGVVLRQVFDSEDFDGESFDPELKTEGLSRTVAQTRGAQDKYLKKSWEVLLVRNESMKDPSINYWGFPKGHIEPYEKSEQAALREILEETGVQAKVIQKLGDSKYVFQRDGEKVFKVVVMFLMEYQSGDLKRQNEEIGEVKWVDFDEAMEVLSFSKDKEFLKQAMKGVSS